MKTKTKQRGSFQRTEYCQLLGKNSGDISRDVWNFFPVFQNLHSCIPRYFKICIHVYPGISKFAFMYSRYFKICIHVFPVFQICIHLFHDFSRNTCDVPRNPDWGSLTAFFLSVGKCTVSHKLALLLQKHSCVHILLLLLLLLLLLMLSFPNRDDNFLMPNKHASFNAHTHAHTLKSS